MGRIPSQRRRPGTLSASNFRRMYNNYHDQSDFSPLRTAEPSDPRAAGDASTVKSVHANHGQWQLNLVSSNASWTTVSKWNLNQPFLFDGLMGMMSRGQERVELDKTMVAMREETGVVG